MIITTPSIIPDLSLDESLASRIQIGPILGNGGFATVYLGKISSSSSGEMHVNRQDKQVEETNYNSKEDQFCAVKCIHKLASDKHVTTAHTELAVLSACGSVSRVAQLQFAFETDSMIYIGLEYCPGSDLHRILTTYGIEYDQALLYLSQIANGLAELHNANIVYHDLKLENICIDQHGEIKFVDFGLATILDNSTYNASSRRREVVVSSGTIPYTAPEIILRQAHAFEADWWSFGVLAYELLSGQLPFFRQDLSPAEQCAYICSSVEFHRNEVIAPGSVEESFVSLFLQKDPRKRFGYDSIDLSQLHGHELFVC